MVSKKRIMDRNPLAMFVNCDNHNLNLVGVLSASQDLEAMMFSRAVDQRSVGKNERCFNFYG